MGSDSSELNTNDLHLCKFPNRRALLSAVQRDGGKLTVSVPSDERVIAGESLRLKVSFADCSRNFYLSGRVQSVKGGPRGPVGYDLLISTAAEQQAFSHLFAFCARAQEPSKRFPASIECTIRFGKEAVSGRIRDLSMTGAFIASAKARWAEGSEVIVEVKSGFLGLKVLRFTARVVWHGQKSGARGAGTQFVQNSSQEVMQLLRDTGLRG